MDMLSFVYESTVFLGFSYVLYYVFLRRSRSFAFIRYYFLLTLLFAVIIPFIEIGSSLPLVGGVVEAKYYTFLPVDGEVALIHTGPVFSLSAMLLLAYLMGLSLMLFRFLINLIRLARKGRLGVLMDGKPDRIFLTEEMGLPYSFFRNIYINRKIFERGEGVDKLLLHERAHCEQGHSADILFAECLKVILWFNPFVWLIAKAIRLNHEYMADEKVLETQSRNAYQLLLLNMELANQSIYLTSDFNFSLTKKRLAMMNHNNSGKKAMGKYVVFPLFLFLVLTLTFCEGEQKSNFDPYANMEFYANDWWKPILEKHDITPRAYNNFESIFEMGSTNSIDENSVVTLTDAFFLILKNENSYAILRSPSATHNLKTGIISGAEGTLETYDLYQAAPEPTGLIEMKNFIYQLVENTHDIRADYLVLYEQGEEYMKGWTGSYEARDSLVFITD